jgi:hypothetical protein
LCDLRATSRFGLPWTLNELNATNYLHSADRARGTAGLPDFARIACVDDSTGRSSNSTTFASCKAAILAIEAALPIGSIDITENGPWRREYAQKWRVLTQKAEGPARLMQCVIHLEDIVDPEWMKEDISHMRACLPARWKAVPESSPSSLAVRIILLDRSLKYGAVDRKRFNSKKKKPSRH